MLDIGDNLKETLAIIVVCMSVVLILGSMKSCAQELSESGNREVQIYLDSGCEKASILGSAGTTWVCPGKELTSE